MYPPRSRPLNLIVSPQCVRCGEMLRLTEAGTTMFAVVDVDGSTVVVPPYTARASRDGPAGTVADQLPSPAVVVTAAVLNPPPLVDGAV